MHSKRLQAFDFNRMQVFSGPYLLHSKRFLNHGREIGQVMVSFVNCENEIHRSRKSLFSWKLFLTKWKIRERNPEDIPQLRTAKTENLRTITFEMCASACRNVKNCLLRCVVNNYGCIPFHKLSLYVFNKIKKLKICFVVPKKIHFEVVRFEPKHPIVYIVTIFIVMSNINSVFTEH